MFELKSHPRTQGWTSDLRGGGAANDECAGAIVMTVNGSCQTVSASLDGATQSMDPATCSGFTATEANDVWFSFVATGTTTTIEVTGGVGTTDPDTTGVDPVLEVFEGTCADLVSMGCADATAPAGTTEMGSLATVIGNTYYYRVYYWLYGAPPTNYSFTTCVYSLVAPDNDDCAGAAMLTPSTYCSPTNFSATGATESLPGIECNGFTGSADDDLWFSFVATQTDMAIGAIGAGVPSGEVNTIYDAVIEAFDGCDGSSLGCADDSLSAHAEQLPLSGLTVGNTYYFRVYHWYSVIPTINDVAVCVVEGSDINIGIQEAGNKNNWGLFPNPAQNNVSLNYNGEAGMGNIEIFDVAGRQALAQRSMLNKNSVHTMDVQALASGVYTVRVTVNGQRSEQRLVIE